MRIIKINKWEVKLPDGKTREENLVFVLSILINNQTPEDMPKGIEKFQIFGNIGTAFDVANGKDVLVLEEREYGFIKEIIETRVPSAWGLNPDISLAIQSFMDAKQEPETS